MDRAGGKAPEDGSADRRGRAQVDRQLERGCADEVAGGGEDGGPPEVGERDEAGGVVELVLVVVAQAEPAAGDSVAGAGEDRHAEAGAEEQLAQGRRGLVERVR